MRTVLESILSVVTGVFTLGEADLVTIGINMIMGLSMFLPMTVGQLSFGQAGFMSIGAFFSVVLTLYAGVWFPLALLGAGLASGLVGFLVGVPVLRLRGLLLALVTFAFAQVVEVFFLNFTPTGAAEGIRGIYPYTNVWYVYGFLAVLVIFHNVLRLGTWNVHEVALLYALSTISFAFTDLLVGHLDQFPQKIRDGNFDILLARPRGTLFQVVASDFQLRRLGRAVQGVAVLVFALDGLQLHWTVGRLAMLLVTIPSAVVIFASVWVVGSCLAFWTTDGGEFTNAFTYGGTFLAQYPIDILSSWLRRFLAYIVPLAFVAYFPALYILDKPDPLGLPRALEFAAPFVALVGVGVARTAWRFAVRHYRSAGG